MGTIEETLTDGWEPEAPVGDTMLRRFLFNQADLNETVALAGGGRHYRDNSVSLADLGRSGAYFNAATLLAPPEPDHFEDTLGEIEEFFEGGSGMVALCSAWPTGDLRSRGWELSGHPPLLVRPPASRMPPPERPDVDAGVVLDAAALAEWEQVAAHGYPFEELQGAPAGSLVSPQLLEDDRFGFWTGRHDGRPVSIAMSFTAHGLVDFALGVTMPEARRLGHWQRHAVERLLVHPELWAVGMFSDHSRPGAEALGFVPLLRLTVWIRHRP